MKRKGIILAGGAGTRLHPSTISVSKQLMPVFDKPMIYYPLFTLMTAGLREILIITTPADQPSFQKLLGDGSQWGMSLQYAVQPNPEGLAQALIIAEGFLAGGPAALILGDNLFFGDDLSGALIRADQRGLGSTVFGYQVKTPEQYGVIDFNSDGEVVGLIEKPKDPPSNYAVTGLYFYDEHAPQYAKKIKPSGRGELEITALNEIYLNRRELCVELLDPSNTWLDTGTHRSLLQAAQFVSVIEERQGMRICCPEIAAFQNGWINSTQLSTLAKPLEKSGYGEYLQLIAQRNNF